MCVPSPRSGFVRGKTPVESVHTKSAKTTSQLQWTLIRMPAIRPIAKLDPILTTRIARGGRRVTPLSRRMCRDDG